ncbi:unnamed protein product [Chrysodeixis includens]|uniref:Carboxylic ester hydrolase n=1 Tax=Chrysodeixis includens TaxID=689277 RepID=A0A9N8PZJ9_CHRIL|nr:unnamed protein product [Chrysodeixis includens]
MICLRYLKKNNYILVKPNQIITFRMYLVSVIPLILYNVLIVYCGCSVITIVASDGIEVTLKNGKLKGEMIDLVTGDGEYYSFKGIPYAQPPIGQLRFKAPLPVKNWEGVRNATQHGSVCPQVEILSNIFVPGNEDCLFINVYSPNIKPETLLPVIVFIHGGGYRSGSGNDASYGPDFLVRKNMVAVTLNYRVDALGFLSLGTEDVPGNAGLKDQVLALKWVQNNIHVFGGDRNRVTIMGQSAGSASVALHVSSPMSKGLFQRAIAMSGAPISDWGVPLEPERRAFTLGKQLGFETRDSKQLLSFLQNVTSDKLVNTAPYVLSFEEYSNNVLRMYPFVPVVEKCGGKNRFLTYDITKKVDHINKADILFGYANQETASAIEILISVLIPSYNKYPELFVPRKLFADLGQDHILGLADEIRDYYFGNKTVDVNSIIEFVTYGNNAAFVYDIINYFTKLPVVENTVRYGYQFSSMSSRNLFTKPAIQYGINGAGHFEELDYLFDRKSSKLNSDRGSEEFRLIEQITTLFTNFAKYGNPTPDSSFGITWPKYDTKSRKYVDIGSNLTVLTVNDNDNVRFWDSIYEKANSLLNQN